MIEHPLYTWVDIQAAIEALKSHWPSELYSARAYWDGVVFEHADGGGGACVSWLAGQFGPRWLTDESGCQIRLESCAKGPTRVLSVTLDEAGADAPVGIARRSFRQPDTAMRREPLPPASAALQPKVLAWHSFKGGVGRTTMAVQFSRLLASIPGTSVMLVDMDFEAPGITWMTEASRLPSPPICLADVLALTHSTPPEEQDEVIALAVERLRDSLVDQLIILPAFRAPQREADVRPEHLEHAGMAPLADILARIGSGLEITHVVCDLRAGRSELAAGLLLDSRIARVLVTTCGGQSVKGTVQMLEALSGTFPKSADDPAITVLVSKVESAIHFGEVRDTLITAADVILSRLPEETPFPLRFTAACHSPGLLTLPLDWVDVVQRLEGRSELAVSDFGVDMSVLEWVASESPSAGPLVSPVGTPAIIAPQPGTADPTITVDERRERLRVFTEPMLVAEARATGPLLPAQFLKRLAQAHRYRLPVAVVVGEKGAGKTFTFLQLVAHRNWREFTTAVECPASATGRVSPVLWPGNLQDEAKQVVDEVLGEENAADNLRSTISHDILEAKKAADEHFDWREWWLDRLLARSGIRDLAEMADNDEPPLLVLDGLEELLPDVHSDPIERRCLRALLQDVPTWIRGVGSRVGLLVFVRSDYVSAAIEQNVEQFFAQYRAYELWWDHHEARRLVHWATITSGALDGLSASDESALTHVWGQRTGPRVSPPAPMDAWVMDAMSTRKQLASALKARDVVRLLAVASKLSVGRGSDDRLLEWSAILEALDVVGQEKVRELREQNPELGHALERIGNLRAEKTVPFRYPEISDGDDRLALLQLEEQDIAWQERREVWLVPLYRRGLGLRLAPRRRERVLR